MDAWIVTILIFLPVAGGLACFVFPFGGRAVASFGLLVALVEVGFWIEALARFDFSKGLQFEQQASWFSDLNVSYHVGMYGFSLWLVGLTVVVMAAAIAYAFLAGRDRPRAIPPSSANSPVDVRRSTIPAIRKSEAEISAWLTICSTAPSSPRSLNANSPSTISPACDIDE